MTRLATLSAPARPNAFRSAVFDSSKRPSGDGQSAAEAYEDLKMFATGWLGGLVFFGTFLA
jgi:hypothetical protein